MHHSSRPPQARHARYALLLLAALLVLVATPGNLAHAQNLNFPQDTASPGIQMGSAPAFASFNGRLYVAFRANDASHILFISSSTDGVNFPSAKAYPNVTMGSAPSLAVFNNRLYVAFQANDANHQLYLTSSSDGVNFPGATGYPSITVGGTPGLAAFNNQLFVTFRANDSSNSVWTAHSSDGINFATELDQADSTGTDPAIAAFNGRLYLAFRSNDTRNVLYVTSSSSGSGFPPATAYTNIAMGAAPAMAAANGALYIAFPANDASHNLFVTASSSGSGFPSATRYQPNALGGPAGAAAFGAGLSIGYPSNDQNHTLYVTSNGGSSNSTGASYQVIPGKITVDLNNGTRGTYADNQVYVEILGYDPSNNALSWVSPDGALHAVNTADNTSGNSFSGPDGKRYPNYAFTLGQSKHLVLPQMYSGRAYISLGSPMFMSVVGTPSGFGYSGPNPQNSADPNNNVHYDWYEFTFNGSGVFINTTQVDQFGLPLLLDVFGSVNGVKAAFHKQTGITESVAALDQEYANETPGEFRVTPVTSYRIFAPSSSANFQAGASNGTYLDGYIGAVWNQYASTPLTVQVGNRQFTGKTQGPQFAFNENNLNNGAFQGGTYYVQQPSTQNTLRCNGAFSQGNPTELALEAQLCAAFNRHVAENYNNWTNPATYYQQAPNNYYARFWHNHSVGALAYGFAYDDVNNQSSTIQSHNPEHMVWGLGW